MIGHLKNFTADEYHDFMSSALTGSGLTWRIEEERIIRRKSTEPTTKAAMTLTYNGTEYPIEYDFQRRITADDAHFIWTAGNWSCDCHRSDVLPIPEELQCGNTITMKDFVVISAEDSRA